MKGHARPGHLPFLSCSLVSGRMCLKRIPNSGALNHDNLQLLCTRRRIIICSWPLNAFRALAQSAGGARPEQTGFGRRANQRLAGEHHHPGQHLLNGQSAR